LLSAGEIPGPHRILGFASGLLIRTLAKQPIAQSGPDGGRPARLHNPMGIWWAVAVSPDGTEVWVGHNEDGGISIIDVATSKVKEVVKLAQMPIRLKFTPDGSKVLVSDPKAGEFIVIDAKTRKEIKRLKAEGTPVGIQLQPDGKRAFVARMEAGNVGVFDLEKMEFVATINPGEGPDGMAWATAKN